MAFLKTSRIIKTFARRGEGTMPPTADVRPSAADLAAQMLAEEFGPEAPAPSRWSLAMLRALQSKNVYQGTVPAHVTKRRRAKNKVARKTRRLNRVRAK